MTITTIENPDPTGELVNIWREIPSEPNLCPGPSCFADTWIAREDAISRKLYNVAHDGISTFLITSNFKTVEYSTDNGITWTPSLIPQTYTGPIYAAAYGNGIWIAVGDTGLIARSIDNGVTWTGDNNTSIFNFDHVSSIVYDPIKALWVAVGFGVAIIATSIDDGITWIERANTFGAYNIYDIAYNGVDLYVAVGEAGNISTSINGIDWIAGISGTIQHLVSISYGGGYWIACGSGGTIIISNDGINWTTQSISSSNLNSIAYNANTKEWVIVANSGQIYTSRNRFIWELQTNPFGTIHINGVIAGCSSWVAVGDSGIVATSSCS